MTSAAQRMQLYQHAYGLTELRLYTSVFMAWLALVFVWFGVTVLRGRRQRFAWGATVAGLAAVAALDLMNPSALVARVNLSRFASGAAFDAEYLTQLGGDAVPAVAEALDALPAADQCRLSAWIRSQADAGAGDWRHWNRGRAGAVVAARGAVLSSDDECAPAPEERGGAHLPVRSGTTTPPGAG